MFKISLRVFFISFVSSFLLSCSHISAKPETKLSNKQNTESYDEWHSLSRAHWTLTNIKNRENKNLKILKSGLEVKNVKLNFSKNRIGFSSGCNGHGGSVNLLPKKKISIRELMSTVVGCNKKLQNGEREFSNYIRKLENYEITGTEEFPKLTLTTQDKVILEFEGELTAETKYGAPKKFVIELNRWRKKDCISKPCIQWRVVIPNKNNKGVNYKFDKRWIPVVGNDSWNTSYQVIEKFHPSENRKYILQIKEFRSDKLPNKILWVSNGSLSSSALITP